MRSLWSTRRLKFALLLFMGFIVALSTFIFINFGLNHSDVAEINANSIEFERHLPVSEDSSNKGEVLAGISRKNGENAQRNNGLQNQIGPLVVPTHSGTAFTNISCRINGDDTANCLFDSKTKEVFFPFNGFLRDYLEIQGIFSKDLKNNAPVFEWWHSYAKLHLPPEKYDPSGAYGPFALYAVENRDRVKCVSGTEEVPMSIQWDPKPYFYPIQVAQFALEHYSKNLSTDVPEKVVEIGTDWHIPPDFKKGCVVERVVYEGFDGKVTHIKTDESVNNPGVFVQLDSQELHVLQASIRLAASASFTVTINRSSTTQEFYQIHYVQRKMAECVVLLDEEKTIVYGLDWKFSNVWHRFTRNILTDFAHGLEAGPPGERTGKGNKKKRRRNLIKKSKMEKITLVSFAIRGEAWISELKQKNSAHMDQFKSGADWFLENQDSNGGWGVSVKRSLADKKLRLQPGWYSAMGQGHAMSVLCRAYVLFKDERYLRSAEAAVAPFSVDAENGGVRNYFLGDNIPWYEEYPTVPGSFVLNGFIYSLIGLYDLKSVGSKKAGKLYEEGLKSLKKLLPIFDTGSGSVYDLRHVSLGNVPPNLARWDYHAVHIYQLLWLYSLEKDEVYRSYAERWIGYAKGERAKHN